LFVCRRKAGLGFITFFWKVMKNKNNPVNPVDPVQKIKIRLSSSQLWVESVAQGVAD